MLTNGRQRRPGVSASLAASAGTVETASKAQDGAPMPPQLSRCVSKRSGHLQAPQEDCGTAAHLCHAHSQPPTTRATLCAYHRQRHPDHRSVPAQVGQGCSALLPAAPAVMVLHCVSLHRSAVYAGSRDSVAVRVTPWDVEAADAARPAHRAEPVAWVGHSKGAAGSWITCRTGAWRSWCQTGTSAAGRCL